MDIQEVNPKAISLWANMPPYLPVLEIIPMALVAAIHFLGVREKLFEPELFLIPSNSRGLEFGLCLLSQIPRYSTVFLFLSQSEIPLLYIDFVFFNSILN